MSELAEALGRKYSLLPNDTLGVNATELHSWGSFAVLEEGQGYKIKRVEVKPGCGLGSRMHTYRSNHWIVVSGTALITIGEQDLTLSSNQSTYVPQNTKYCIKNVGVLPLVLVEVQNGEYLEESDVIRFEADRVEISNSSTLDSIEPDQATLTPDFSESEAEISTLINLLHSKNSQTRQEAALALGRIGAENAVPALCDLLSTDGNSGVRRGAAEALGMIGCEKPEIEG